MVLSSLLWVGMGVVFQFRILRVCSWAGRGSENKVPFIAAVQTNEQNNPVYAVFSKVKTFSGEEVKIWAKRSLVPERTMIVSDGL